MRTSGFSALIALPTPVMSPPPPMLAITAGSPRGASSRISRPIVACPAMKLRSSKGCTKVPSTPGHRTLLQRLPGDRVRHEDEPRTEGSHPLDLGSRRGLDRHDRTGNARLTRRIGNALPGIARTDGPDAAPALGLREHRNRVGGTAQLVGVDRLQILQLQPDVRVARPEFEAHQRRAQNGCGDSLARGPDRRPIQWGGQLRALTT